MQGESNFLCLEVFEFACVGLCLSVCVRPCEGVSVCLRTCDCVRVCYSGLECECVSESECVRVGL